MFDDDPFWYKDAVIYELHVKAFFDSSNDGTGDFRGLIQKLDYIRDLGVNTLWLLPFYPSPMRDDGYDIADYRNISPEYGTMADFRQFVREAHRRNLRVITELVINHTSDRHPWFQAARHAPAGSVKRDYYVWSDSDRKFPETRIIFTDTEKSNWAWDTTAQAYYWHRFFSHQPDLNLDNPHVVKAIMRVMRYWLDAGVDGLRLDAVPYLCVREGTGNENLPETHAVIKYMRAELDRHYENRMFLAEANQWPEDVRDYFGDGDECHMAYHFPLMPRMFMAIAQEDRHPIVEIMQQTPDIPDNCQWAIFLRNHDELTLEMVTDRERDYMYQMYAAELRARVNVGIRRRLAPLMDNDLDKIKLMNSLLLSMPGSPIIYYGDEIGMGDNLYLGDRNSVRTPMQWSPDRNAGFSRADPQQLYHPPIMDAVYGYETLNVEAQARNPSSLLNWTRRMLAVRKNYQAFGRGTLIFLRPRNRKILAYLRAYGETAILCVANLARTAQPVELELSAHKGCVPVELMGRTAFPPVGDLPYLLTLPSHGFYWFRLARDKEGQAWYEEQVAHEELPVLVLFDGWRSFFRDRVVPWRIAMSEQLRAQFEREMLPRFIVSQRWYPAKGDAPQRAALADHAEWGADGNNWLLAFFHIEAADEQAPLYFLPLALAMKNDEEIPLQAMPFTLAKVRQQARMGVIADAFSDASFCCSLVEAIGQGQEIHCEHGVIRFCPTAAYHRLATADLAALPVFPPDVQGNHSTVALGQTWFLKGYRGLHAGPRPAVEFSRFLTGTTFSNMVPVAGTVEYVTDGATMIIALLQEYVENQGDFWDYTLDFLGHFLGECRAEGTPASTSEAAYQAYLILLHALGLRTAELHKTLASAGGDPLFEAESIVPGDLAAWAGEVHEEAEAALRLLDVRRYGLTESVQAKAGALLEQRQLIAKYIDRYASAQAYGLKIRCHGDYRLGQILLSQNDVLIADREDDATGMFPERLRKQSPMRDVAGMLRSFHAVTYAALLQASAERPDNFAVLEPFARNWTAEAVRIFLADYDKAAGGSGLYDSWDTARGLLDLFVLEQAFRELRDHLDHQPEWVHISISNILEQLHGVS